MIFSDQMLMFVVVSFLAFFNDPFAFLENEIAEEVFSDFGVCHYDVKHLQRKIAEGKTALVRFQKYRNPMGFPLEEKKTEEEKPVEVKGYIQRGIWYEAGGKSTAIIDGNMVKAGQYLPDGITRVISITRDQVVIKRGGKKFVLRVDSYGNAEEEKSEK